MRLAVQPCNIGKRIAPAHAHHGVVGGLRKAGLFPAQLRILLPFQNRATTAAAIAPRMTGRTYKSCVLIAGHVIPAEREPRQRNLMLWRFVRNCPPASAVRCS